MNTIERRAAQLAQLGQLAADYSDDKDMGDRIRMVATPIFKSLFTPPNRQPSLSKYFNDEELEYVAADRKIMCIKSVRTRLNLCLKDAKKYVEDYNPSWEPDRYNSRHI